MGEPTYGEASGATAVLAAFAAGTGTAATSHADEVSRALADTVAVAVAAATSEGDAILRSWAGRENAHGQATAWTSGETTSASMAALLNGTAGHLLDYDDISPSMPMHPSTVLFPALLAVAEQRGIDGGRLVQAYDVGAATFRALADLLPQHVHYARGWHTTSTVGRLATVAALVRLCGTPAATAEHALGLVSSLVAGSRPNFGSMTKPLHAGVAARDAVMALELAEAGFTANTAELEAPGGFLERFGDPELAPIGDAAETLAERLEYWQDAWVRDWGLKRYPACYGTHRGIDAVLELRAQVGDRPIRSITATLHPNGTRPLGAYPPRNATQAKFSLEYALAAAIIRGNVLLSDFTEEAFADERVRSLMERVSVGESAEPPLGDPGYGAGFTVVEIAFEDGGMLARRVDITRGDALNPLDDDQLHTKFTDCCAIGGLTPEATGELYSVLRALPHGGRVSAAGAALAPGAWTPQMKAPQKKEAMA